MGNPNLAKSRKVRRRLGIMSTDDGLNAAIHDWDGPVGRFIITRID